MSSARFLCSAALVSFALMGAATSIAAEPNNYEDTRLVANKAKYKAAKTDPKMINAWGIVTRPAGAGGHFWVTGDHTSFQYVGDVKNSPDKTLRTLHTDKLSHVKLPIGPAGSFATGVVFLDGPEFLIGQKLNAKDMIAAPAKFMFASDAGIVAAWTERKNADGTFTRPNDAIPVIDLSKQGSQFFGIAVSKFYNRLYLADFGATPTIRVYDGKFKPMPMIFDMPFDTNKNGKVDPGEYAPFNVQTITTPTGDGRVMVTYAMTQACPEAEIKKATCKKGELFVGEEDTSKPGLGRLAEFNENGKLVAIWADNGKLSAPWGVAYAPANFGAMSNRLLVGNFGDGTIAAYDNSTRKFIDYLRGKDGKPIVIDKLWGITFGNGISLGDSNALYYAAGPDDEKDGLFGSLRPVAAATTAK